MRTSPAGGRAHALRALGISALSHLWSYAVVSAVVAVGTARAMELLVDDAARDVFRVGAVAVVAAIAGLSYPAVRDRLTGRA